MATSSRKLKNLWHQSPEDNFERVAEGLNFDAKNKKNFYSRLKIVFCISYLNIPITLTIVEQSSAPFLIATCNDQVYQFFAAFYPKEKLIYFEKAKSIITKNPYAFVFNAIFNHRLKQRLNALFMPYIHCDVYFFLHAFAESAAYTVKYLSRRNQIFHIPSLKDDCMSSSSRTLTSFLNIIAKKLVFDLDVDVTNNGKREIYHYSENYFRSLNCIRLNKNLDHNTLSKFQKLHLNIVHEKILILAGLVPESGMVDREHYSLVMDELIQALPVGKVVIKLHPRACQKFSAENELPELPKEWPANLLMYNFPVVIGYHSASIYEAANNDCVAISLLDLMEPTNPSLKNYYKSYLIKHLSLGKTIYFPHTIDELLGDIIDVI